jgi:transcriptional regulator with XRE-family HTH domain
MSEPAQPDVGGRIRAIRERRGWSLRALSGRSGLSVNAISLIERGENSPTVSSLHQLATALDVPITAFFEDPSARATVFTGPEARLRSEAGGILMESLALGLRHQQMEPFLITLEPGAGASGERITHPGEEFVHCLAGEPVYAVGERVYDLHPGDSLLFEASQPHCFYNPSAGQARLLIVFLSGDTGHLARQRHMAPSAGPPEGDVTG